MFLSCERILEVSSYLTLLPVVFQDVSFTLKPGRITALVGSNSSGKSTCVKLLERFYQPQAGDILLDGQPLKHYRDQYLHEKVTHAAHTWGLKLLVLSTFPP